MTARPQSYDAVTIDTLKKLGIDMNGVKLISRTDKDWRKPEQMKYDKTSKYRQWYDIEEFYDDMAKTRGALGIMGINAIDPLKLAKGTPRVLDAIEQKFPGMFTQLPKSRMMQHSEGATKPKANKKVFTSSRLKSFKFEDTGRTYDLDQLANLATMITQGEFSNIGKSVFNKQSGKYKRIGLPTFEDLLVNGKPILGELPGYQKYSFGYGGEQVYSGIARNKTAILQSLQEWIYEDDWGKEVSEFTVNGIPAKTFFKGMNTNPYRIPGQKTKAKPYFFADGVFSVPGPKGAGDVVPAMLSPGEAVIPAKQAAQHRPMIKQMIAGNLPGYMKGTAGVPGYSKGIPGVPEPSGVPSEPEKSSGLFGKIANTIIDSSKKAGDVLVSKAKDAGEKVAGKLVDKYLNPNNDRLKDSKGEVVNEERIAALEEAKVVEQKTKTTILNREQIEEQLAAEDDDYRLLLEKEKELKLKHVLTDEERKLLESNKQIMLKKEEAFKLQKNVTEKEKRAGLFSRNATTGKVQGLMYGLSGAAGLASTVPGAVGESAQQMLPVIGAATAAMSIIPGYAGMIVGAGAALVTAYMQVQEKLNKIRDEALALGTAMGSSTKSIDKFAEFAKTVTGSQAMDKRRETSAGAFFNVVQGKTTFGESYMKSDAGKELVKSVGASIKGGGLDQAKAMITNQLTTAIASGAMSPAQARSIASNLGAQLGDMSLGIEVAGRITDLVGPKGEDLKKEPLQVRMRLVADSVDQFKKQAEISNANATDAAKNAGTSGAGIGIGAGAGLAAGFGVAGAGSIAAGLGSTGILAGMALGTTAGSVVPVIGTIAGALVGFSIAAVQLQGDIAKNAGYLQASLGSSLSVQQQMVDSLAIDYEKRIATAKAAGDIAEATRLQNQYLADQAELLQFNKEQTQDMYSILESQGTGLGFMLNAQIANLDTAREGLKKAFEGTGQEVQAKLAQEQIDSMAGSAAQKTMLMSAVAQKQIGLNQIGVAKTAFGADQAGADTLQKLMENSPTELNRTLGLAGNMGAVEQKKFLVSMSLEDPIEAKAMNDAVELAQKTTGVFFGEKKTAEAIMRFAVENPEKMLEFQQNIADLQNVDKARFDITVAQKILGPDLAKALGEKSVGAYFKKYNKQNKIVFLSEFQQVMTMLQEGDKDMIDSYNAWNASNGMKKTYADYAAWQSDRTVTTQGVDNTFTPGEGGGGTTEKAGPSASFIDPYVQTIREAINLAQNITVGWFDSLKALNKYKKGTVDVFSGQAVLLKQAGASEGLIQAFLGGSEEDQNRMFDRAKGGISETGRIIIAKAKQVEDAKIGLEYILAGPMGQLQKQNELFQSGLDVISGKEKKVNEKYDKRVKVLDQIGKLQDKNNQRQQDTLTLADALSKGDIAAAARAAMAAKQNIQKLALEDAKESVELARKKELGEISVKVLGETVTRADLEEKIAANAADIAASKLLELDRQTQIGIKAQETADALSAVLNTYKGFSKIDLPDLKVANISANSLNAQSINGNLTNNPPPPPPPGGKDPTAGLDDPVVDITDTTNPAGRGGAAILNNIIKSKGMNAATAQAKTVRKNFISAEAKLSGLGGAMTDAKAAQKFGGKNTANYKLWKTALGDYKKAKTAAEEFSLFTSTGNIKTEQMIATMGEATLRKTEGYKDYAKGYMDKLPAAVTSRLHALKNSNADFIADQNNLKTFKTKIDNIKNKFTGTAQEYKNKSVYEMWQNYQATNDSLKPKTAWGQLLAGGADPNGYLNAAIEMVKKFSNMDVYRKNLREAGYTTEKLQEAGLLGYGNGQTVETVDDFKNHQMFRDRKAHAVPKQSNVDADNISNFANRFYASGGMVLPNGYKVGGGIYGTDTVPAMLTPGEFVIRKAAVDSIGIDKLNAMNSGTSVGESVYNYSITVNATGNMDANDLARKVMEQIKQVDSQRMRSNNY
jgi:hypothetical protein